MTQERFIDFLKHPDGLSSIPYEELKTLALAYPYAHNLRYLLALKSQQDHHPEAARNLATAAAHSLDRTRLFALVAPAQLTPQRLKEEVLELKPIKTIQRELEALSPVLKEEIVDKQVVVESAAPPAKIIEPPLPPPDQQELAPTLSLETPKPPTATQDFSAWMGAFNPPTLQPTAVVRPAVEGATDLHKKKAAPTPPYPAPKPQLPHDEDTPTPPSSGSPRSVAQELAERSVAENKDVISETLARLLAKQGYRDKAIAMYERLGLAFPEKSSFFAAEIDKLKK